MVRSERSVADYEEFFDPVRTARQERNGKQPGSPAKPAEAILHLARPQVHPTQLLFGRDAYSVVWDRITRLKQEIEDWKELTLSTGLIKTRTHPSTEAARGGSNFAELSSTRHMRQIVIRLLELL